ncbi:MAG TPA: hypothetical protein VFY75_00560 [Solirubrobacterales bacterium]|nr:hypothetical protein [Solirubrobacterales bacterium]
MGAIPQAGAQTTALAGLLAVAGGATFFLLTIFATVYQPLHYDYPVNYGDSVQFGDVLVFALGVGAAILGMLILMRPGDNVTRGWGLLMTGVPVFVLAAVWAFSDIADLFSQPFHFGYVFFADFGRVETDTHLIQVPLLIAGAMVIGAGLLALSAGRQSPPPR